MVTTNPAIIAIGSIGLIIACLYLGSKVGDALQFILAPSAHRLLKPGWVDAVGTIAGGVVGVALAFALSR